MKDAIDGQLREQQAGFRKKIDLGLTKSPRCGSISQSEIDLFIYRYINFVYYEKAFDSVRRQSLWKLPRHYGIPEKITNIIRNSYEGMTCRVVLRRQLIDAIEVKTGVSQGCLLSPVMFLLTMD